MDMFSVSLVCCTMILVLASSSVDVAASSLGVAASLPGIAVERRVVNGRTMVRGEWPFLVSLHYLKPFPFTRATHMKHLCGGALIHPQWVITAAHCVGYVEQLKIEGNWEVVLGEHNQYLKDLGEQTVKPEAFFTHPGFQPHVINTLKDDIALIKLKEPANLSHYVGLVELNNNTDLPEHMPCQIGGWGQVSDDLYGWGMYIPLKSTVHVISNDECSKIYSELSYEDGDFHLTVDPSVLCAGIPASMQSQLQKDGVVGTSDACNGDSGSPLLCQTGPSGQYQIVGVVSAGKGCGTGKFPGIYTRVSYFYDWIKEIMDNN